MKLTSPVDTIPGVGSIMAKKLANLKINTVFDLLYHLPFRYEDRRKITPISQVQPGEIANITGTISAVQNIFTKNGKRLQTATLSDDSGKITVIWFNQMYLSKALSEGDQISLYGKIDFFGRKLAIISPEYSKPPTHSLVSVYPETAGISSKWLHSKLLYLFKDLQDLDPLHLESLNNIHFPKSLEKLNKDRKNLAFDELLLLHLSVLKHQETWKNTKLAHPFYINQEKVLRLINNLPFALTPSQNQAVKDVLSDLSKPQPMNRLLEGDVGSGKTVIAAIASYIAYLNGFQTIILAPTQILANQHFNTLKNLLDIPIALVTSSKKINLDSQILVGTHALLSNTLQLNKVGLVIIDEQHRFGVIQRSLAANKGISPHILTMTATPIPRTIALTLYGDLDLSTLDLIPNRQKVKTWVVPELKRQAAYEWIKKQNTQAFIICPFIEESESLTSVKAAKVHFETLKNIFPEFKLGLLHGKLKTKEKDMVLEKFRTGEYHILVSTSVVEVGIDIPNANIIVIEDADRFGLSQLHQLRGRVGRGSQQAYCLLFSTSSSERLKVMEKYHSGFELAEIDLKLRGAGNLYGTTQHGSSSFKVVRYDDFDLIPTTKKLAQDLFSQLNKYPLLQDLIEKDKIDVINPN